MRRAITLVLLIVCWPAMAAEQGQHNFPIGAQTLAAALLPPPGATALYGYSLYYHADTLRGQDGDSAVPGFDADVIAAAPRLIHTWGTFGGTGVNYGSGIVIEGVRITVSAAGATDNDTGGTLLGFEPFNLTWSSGNWHFLSGTLVYLPLGSYDPLALANSTIHRHSLAQQFSATWMTARWDVSLNSSVEYGFENKKTDYKSGVIGGLTWGASVRPFADDLRWQVGVNGFFSRQFNDDEIDGDKVPGDGNRLKKMAAGPQVALWLSPASVLLFKYQREFEVENATRGDLWWFEFAFPL